MIRRARSIIRRDRLNLVKNLKRFKEEKTMKEMKRILSLVLCIVMLVGMMPAIALNADAAEGNNHYLMFATDRHKNTSVIGNIINNMESAIGENQLEYLGLGGDMVGSGNTHDKYNSSTVLAEVTGATSSLDSSNVDIVAGIHDMNVNDDAGIVLPYQGGGAQIYEGNDYYVYGVEEYCISEDSDDSNWSKQAQAFQEWALGDTIDTSKAIFVVSHYPLHAKRDDNDGAMYWHWALNYVATGTAEGDGTVERDIVFFHGHNHTVDSNEYVYNVGDKMSIQNGSSTVSGTIYYTYATAGYLNQNSKATLVTITDDQIVLTKYGTSGSGTAMATVARVVTEETPVPTTTPVETDPVVEGIEAVSSKDTYYVGEALELTVYAVYSDGSKVAVEGYTTEGFDSSVLGTQTVIVTYGAYSTTVSVSVVEESAEPTLTDLQVTYSKETLLGDALTLKVTAVYSDGTTKELAEGEYTVEGYDSTQTGAQGVVVTCGDVSYGFTVVTTDEVTVVADGMASLTVTNVTDTLTETLADKLETGFVAYDIVPNVYNVEKNIAVVSMPAPEGADAVYYWNEETSELESLSDFTFENGKVVFTTNHFSTYVVGAAATTPNDGTATVPGNSSTSTKEVWKLTSNVTAGTYLIVNTNAAGSGYALLNNNGTVSAVAVNVVNDGTNTYIELDNSGAVWTATGSGTSWAFANNGKYLGYTTTTTTGGGSWFLDPAYTNYTYTLGMVESSTSWTLGSNQLYAANLNTKIYDSSNMTGYNETNNYYISGGSSWSMSTSSANVYFYAPATITSTAGTQTATYGLNITVNGTAASTMEAKNVVNGDTLQLGAEFTSTVAGQKPSGGTWNITSSNTAVATIDNNGLVTFTGVAGETVIRAEYTWTVDGVSYTIYNTLTITTTAMSYSMDIVEETATVKIGATQELTLETKDSEDKAVTASDVKWTSSAEDIATVENGVVTGVAAGDATITAEWTDPAGVKHTDTAVISVVDAVYTLDITSDGTVVTGTTISKKGVTASTTLQLGTKVYADGTETAIPANATIEWHIPEEYQNIATVGHDTGLVTFKGVDGAFYVTATLTVNGKDYTVGVNISATTSSYSVPSDGASDFPEYPNEGAIRYDKTATAVGNFSETGIAQVELSMTGVPYNEGSEIDVVMVLDMTGSMDDVSSSTSKPTGYTRVDATIAASKAFIKSIVINEDGSYNKNRIGIYVFNKNGAKTLYDLAVIDTDAKLQSLIGKIADGGTEFDSNYTEGDLDTIYEDYYASGGTPYDDGLGKAYDVLAAAKTDGTGNNRKQFTVFMTDGVPTSLAYVNGTSYSTHSSASAIAGMLTSASNYATRDTDYKYEYYSTEMKKAGVTVYSVGVGLFNENNAWSGSATQCGNLASALLNDISGPANETEQPDKVGTATLSKKDKYFFSVEDADAGTKMTNVFENIAAEIKQAATDVTVEDKITDEYTMIFDIPEGSQNITGVTNDFYIEFGKYSLDENHERTTFTSVTKLYLENTNDVLSAKDAADPVFEQKTIGDKGTLYYWSTDAADGDAGISVEVDGTTYYFVSYGMEEAGYNMTSGAYAYGTVDSTTNMSEDLIIATPYFVYNAESKMIYWTVDKLDTEEYALRYFLYLDNSATEVGTSKETDPGSYLTNDHAYITYTNFKGNDCRQEFPKPQLTWSGAQVSYVFYLVNAQGQPINKSGQVVDFANATFVTDVYTEDTVWNKGEDGKITADSQLGIEWLAEELLPDDYKVYDEQAQYQLHVYGNHDGTSNFDYFTIGGAEASAISSSLNTRLELETTVSTVSVNTTKVYNTKAGQKITGYGTYTSESTDSIDNEVVLNNFDFYNTTVAFAVVWQPRLVEDTVVVDYGLDVIINVVQNDILQNELTGIGLGNSAYGNIAMNTGVSPTSKLGTAALTIDGNTISIENETSVRFHQGDMEFKDPVVFYYETPVEFWEGSDPTEGYMYSSVTVIPATTIYYEDEYVTLTTHTRQEDGTYVATSGWTVNSTDATATQAQDRPGESLISDAIDADNNYGYDAAYSAMSKHSMNGAAKITVSDGIEGQANFDFYGTGFDVISLTDTTTGTITVRVYEYNEDGSLASKPLHSYVVDTYYGYKQDENGDWVTTDSNDPNALYQVPVMKISGLEHGKYRARIVVFYDEFFDNEGNGSSYDFYLDAIRIYDPTGNENNVANDAYVKDGEGWPTYEEVRNYVIDQSTGENLGDEAVTGVVFIDGDKANKNVASYTSYGPNNELYLAPGQAIAFELNATAAAGEIAKVQMAVKSVGGTASVKVYATDGTNGLDTDIATATDMYYDISNLNGKTVVIMNDGSSGVLSITNVKVTYTEAQPEASEPTPAMFLLRRASVDDALATLNVEEEVPETTVPEETEPETTEPETTVPEETEPETTVPEETEPEETKPSHQEQAEQVIRKVVKIIKGFLDWIFG